MKHLSIVAALAVVVVSSSAYANNTEELIVLATPTVGQWSARISHSLDESLRFPVSLGREAPTGVVSVTFNCSDAGLPSDVAVAEPSRFGSLDRAAVRAIKQLKSMHPLPDGIDHGQRFQADLFFAESESELRRMQAAAQRRHQLASANGEIVRIAVRAAR